MTAVITFSHKTFSVGHLSSKQLNEVLAQLLVSLVCDGLIASVLRKSLSSGVSHSHL